MECQGDHLSRTLQQAAAEYAELLFGGQPARDVYLPDDYLQTLVRDRWMEHQSQEFGGTAEEMYTLHVLVGFDRAAQQRILEARDHTEALNRMQGAGMLLGGVLGRWRLPGAG